ncbi:MAG: hypothetical protein RMK30_07160 [Anaerolineae bacterium]|nr:hypothetical protein [Anaerolineae bacterium]MDW8102638.1 hypothetical protein [Anaerolineae bacterium]
MKWNLIVLGAYLALTLLVLWPLPLLFTRVIPGDGFDGWQNYWNLWWISKALLEEHSSPFFTHYLYYPTGVSLLFHTLNLPNGLLAMPLQVLFGTTVAYNFIVFISSFLSGYGAFLLALEITRARWAAFIAGLIYAFSPFRSAHLLGHMQVFSTEWVPFFILFLFRAKRGGSSLLPAVFLVLSSLTDWYQSVYLALFTALYLGWLAWKKSLTLRVLLKVGAIWSLGVLALSPLLIPMLWEMLHYRYMFAPPWEPILFSADLLAFVTPSEFHPLWGELAGKITKNFVTPPSERTVFLGYTSLVLALVAWRKKAESVSLWLITGFFFMLMALGPYLRILGETLPLPLPYSFLRQIPFIAMARTVSRFSLMVTLSLGVLAALGAKALGRRLSPTLAFLILLEYWPAPYPFTPPDTPDFYWKLAQEPGEFNIINLPMNWDRPHYLLYQTVHRKWLVSGYTSREDPRTLVKRMPVLQHFRHLREDIIKVDLAQLTPSVMAYLGVKYVIFDFYQMASDEERGKTLALASEAFRDSELFYRDERLIVYRVLPPEKPVPFLFLGEGWGDFNGSYRSLKKEGSIFLHAPGPSVLHLTMEVSSPSSGTLKVKTSTSSHSIEISSQQPVPISFAVETQAGDNRVEFEWEPALKGAELRVWLLQLTDYDFSTQIRR